MGWGGGGGGRCPTTSSCVYNHRASFLLVKSSTVDLVNIWGSWLSLKHSMMKSSTLFECGPLPPTSALGPIHVIGVPRLSPFSYSFASMYYTECKPKNKKWGRPGNEATVIAC